MNCSVLREVIEGRGQLNHSSFIHRPVLNTLEIICAIEKVLSRRVLEGPSHFLLGCNMLGHTD